MIPGMGGMDSRSMSRYMQQLGIKTEDVAASRVIIEKADGSQIVITEPQVSKITMQGQASFQISGKIGEKVGINPEDVKMVAEQAGVSSSQAEEALKAAKGDIAQAIMDLSEKKE